MLKSKGPERGRPRSGLTGKIRIGPARRVNSLAAEAGVRKSAKRFSARSPLQLQEIVYKFGLIQSKLIVI
jgi:hypothetical protein